MKNLQSSIGLNVAEAEFYALCHGGAHGLGMKSFFADLGVTTSVDLCSDSSSAGSFASRKGLGRQRHVQTRYLWIQERVACKDVSLGKALGTENPADLLTKHLPRETIAKHLEFSGLIIRGGRAEAGLKTSK